MAIKNANQKILPQNSALSRTPTWLSPPFPAWRGAPGGARAPGPLGQRAGEKLKAPACASGCRLPAGPPRPGPQGVGAGSLRGRHGGPAGDGRTDGQKDWAPSGCGVQVLVNARGLWGLGEKEKRRRRGEETERKEKELKERRNMRSEKEERREEQEEA